MFFTTSNKMTKAEINTKINDVKKQQKTHTEL